MRRLICVSLVMSTSALLVATSAYAGGGNSIATAPAVVPGQQEFGNTEGASKLGQFWLLNVTAGDSVVIDWEAQGRKELALNPLGTTDFNVETVQGIAQDENGANGKAELTYTTTSTGTIPLQFLPFSSQPSGPYNFTAYLTHALSVGLPRVGSLRSRGTLNISVHNPEGGPINDPAVQVEVQIKGHGSWQRIGVGTVSNSAAVIPFKVPAWLRHRLVTLRALAHGAGYASTSSAHLKARTL